MRLILDSILLIFIFSSLACHRDNFEAAPKSGYSYIIYFDSDLEGLPEDRLSTHLLDFGGHGAEFVVVKSGLGEATMAKLILSDVKVKKGNENSFYQNRMRELRHRIQRERLLHTFKLKIIDSEGNTYEE